MTNRKARTAILSIVKIDRILILLGVLLLVIGLVLAVITVLF